MTKPKKKKSLVGWIGKDREFNFVDSPLGLATKIVLIYMREKKTEKYSKKVRITIEEI